MDPALTLPEQSLFQQVASPNEKQFTKLSPAFHLGFCPSSRRDVGGSSQRDRRVPPRETMTSAYYRLRPTRAVPFLALRRDGEAEAQPEPTFPRKPDRSQPL